MPFTTKNWLDAPSTSTPISEAALEDMETRLSAYSDALIAARGEVLVAAPTGVAATDTAAIVAARAALPSGKGIVRFRVGTYAVNTQFTLGSNERWAGSGGNVDAAYLGITTIFSTYDGQAFVVPSNTYNWSLENICFKGDRTLTSQDLVVFGQTGAGTVRRCGILNAGRDGLTMTASLHVHCDLVYCLLSKRNNLSMTGLANNNKFTKCQFREADGAAIKITGGTDNHFDTCTIESNLGGGIDIAATVATELVMTACHFENHGAQIPLKINDAIVTEIGNNYNESTSVQVNAGAQLTSVGVQANMATFATIGTGALPCTFVSPYRTGGGVFAVTDTTNYSATIIGSDVKCGRTIGARTPLVAGDFSLSAGWGTTATITSVAGTDSAYRIKVTANGASIAANPAIDLNFTDGAWAAAPIMVANMTNNCTGAAAFVVTWTNTTAAEIQYIGTPSAGLTYEFSVMIRG